MIINHNMNAMNAHRNMSMNTTRAGKAMEKLSSGLRINRAGDDAAGLAISEKMRAQVKGLEQASRNSQDGISMIQTAEGALNETHSILQRMRELAVQAGNDTNTAEDRGQIQQEINQLTSEINRIGNTTEFNNQNLLKGAGNIIKTGDLSAGVDLSTNFKLNLSVDGKDVELDLTKKNYDGSADDKKLGALASDIQAKINASADLKDKGIKVEVSEDGKNLVFNSESAIEFKAASATDALGSLTGISAGDKTTKVDFNATMQIGANKGQAFTIEVGDMRADALGLSSKTGDAATNGAKFTATNVVTNGTDNAAVEMALDVSDHENATKAIEVINDAVNNVSTQRSKLGAMQNRLEHTIANLDTSAENLQASESRIRDVDMAKEMLSFSKDNILQQAAQSMLAQAKSQPEGVLQLLR